jgi:hypothetical protein
MRELLAGDERGGLRALAGLLFGVGMLLVLFRRSSFGDPWGTGALFVCFLVPCAFLYGLGVFGGRAADGPATTWHTVYAVFGVLLVPWTLFLFLDWVGGNTDDSWNVTWIFLLTGISGIAATLVGRVRYGCLLGSLSLLIAWLACWDGVLDDGVAADVGTLRGLLVIAALILLAVAGFVAMRPGVPDGAASDVTTGAAVAAVAAGAISLGAVPEDLLFFLFGLPSLGVDTNVFWAGYLLVASLGFVLYGASAGVRGPTYIGGLGLIAFLFVVGIDAGDESPEGSLLGWPLIVLAAALAALAWSVLPALRRRGE